MTRSFFESLDLLHRRGHDGGSGLSIERDTCFVNIVWRHWPPCLTSESQDGSISHHGNGPRVPDQPNGARGKPLVRATIRIGAPFRPSNPLCGLLEPSSSAIGGPFAGFLILQLSRSGRTTGPSRASPVG